jgi:YD repeat-containing protein
LAGAVAFHGRKSPPPRRTTQHAGLEVRLVDEEGHRTTHLTNLHGEVVATTRHLASGDLTTTFSYDAAGRLQQVTDPSGDIYRYDHYSDGTPTTLIE